MRIEFVQGEAPFSSVELLVYETCPFCGERACVADYSIKYKSSAWCGSESLYECIRCGIAWTEDELVEFDEEEGEAMLREKCRPWVGD